MDKNKIIAKVLTRLGSQSANKLLGSAADMPGIIKIISKFWYSSSISLKPIDENSFDVHNAKGKVEGFIVRKEKGRYRFESIPR